MQITSGRPCSGLARPDVISAHSITKQTHMTRMELASFLIPTEEFFGALLYLSTFLYLCSILLLLCASLPARVRPATCDLYRPETTASCVSSREHTSAGHQIPISPVYHASTGAIIFAQHRCLSHRRHHKSKIGQKKATKITNPQQPTSKHPANRPAAAMRRRSLPKHL